MVDAHQQKMFQSTPPRGRRLKAALKCLQPKLFQSTPPRGRRLVEFDHEWNAPESFNPRLRAGGDLTFAEPVADRAGFNPRLRAGGDRLPRHGCAGGLVSIHASAREATCSTYIEGRFYWFQSTPPRGRRPKQGHLFFRHKQVSIHASAREATEDLRKLLLSIAVSIHASAREATCDLRPGHVPRTCFNPRLRAGGDPATAIKKLPR